MCTAARTVRITRETGSIRSARDDNGAGIYTPTYQYNNNDSIIILIIIYYTYYTLLPLQYGAALYAFCTISVVSISKVPRHPAPLSSPLFFTRCPPRSPASCARVNLKEKSTTPPRYTGLEVKCDVGTLIIT